jgi:hypothetical protein
MVIDTCQGDRGAMPLRLNNIEYSITHKDGTTNIIPLILDARSNALCTDRDFIPPAWAQLERHQCTHCTLDRNKVAFCPIAKNVAFLFQNISFGDSFEEVDLVVRTDSRSYQAHTTLQRALGSLFGLICSQSDCPHTIPLRPMGFFHLPLPTETEAIVRAASFFLLKQYLGHLEDNSVKVDLSQMISTYQNLKELNRCFIGRLREIDTSDAAVNALILLDLMAKDINYELGDYLASLKKLFTVLPGDPS